MLEIFVNNQKVDLPIDIQISLIIENPLLVQDRVPTPYSLTFNLPITANNLTIFKFPDRPASFKNALGVLTAVACRILFKSVTISQGSLLTSQYDGVIKASFTGIGDIDRIKTALYNIDLDKQAYPAADFRDIQFDNPANYAGKYRRMAIDAASGLNDRYVVAPVRVTTENDPVSFLEWKPTRNGMRPILHRPQEMVDSEYINYFNPSTQEPLIRSDSPNPSRGVWAAYHAPVFPFVRIHYLFDRIFNSSLANNIFAEGEFRNLVVLSSYFSNWKPRGVTLISANGYGGLMFDAQAFNADFSADFSLTLNQFMPDVESPDLFRGVLNLFCASVYNKFGRFEVALNRDIMNAPVVANWEAKLIGKPSLSLVRAKRYKYGYKDEEPFTPGDSLVSVTALNDIISSFPSVDPGEELVTVFKIESTGQYFERTIIHVEGEGESDPGEIEIAFRMLDGGYGISSDDSSDSETHDSVSQLKPASLIPKQYWISAENAIETPPQLYWWCVPSIDPVRTERLPDVYIGFFRGYAPAATTGHSYPLVTPYNASTDGSRVGELSLSWDGPDGLLNNFHSEYRRWIENDKLKMQTNILLSELDLNQLDLKSKVHVRGMNFYIERIQITIRHNRIDPAQVDLIEA